MAAHYDNFDYQAYWSGKEYEHESDALAIKALLLKIKRVKRVGDFGAGYGRLTPYYIHRAKTVVLVEPSKALLKEAKKRLSNIPKDKIKFIQSSFDRSYNLLRNKSFDLIIFVRVLHHLEKPEKTIAQLSSLLSDGGYLIIEFPNKLHWKALWKNLLSGNLTYPLEIETVDKRRLRGKNKSPLPVYSFHPDTICQILTSNNFDIIEVRSTSNIRSAVVKRHLPLAFLLSVEGALQKPLGKIVFGPSVFIMARKKSI